MLPNWLKNIFSKSNYDPALEEPVSVTMSFPYNILPKGYPNKISSKKLEEVINTILDDLKANASVEAFVSRDTAFINLGLNELNNRTNKRQSRIAFWLSVFSVIVALLSLLVSVLRH
jgi:hypothetical protein